MKNKARGNISTGLRDEVYKRIVLAKVLHRSGEDACANHNDQMVFTKGILLLHDAAEAALGAVADHLNVKLTGNRYLLDYYGLIEDRDLQKRPVSYRNQMRNLNTIRNNAKHQGILPDPRSNAHFPTTVFALISDLCQTYLGLDFSAVSLKSLIKDKQILTYIEQAEKEIKEDKIGEGLVSLAYAMYNICERWTIPWLFLTKKQKEKPLLFTRTYTTEHTVKLLEHGVDPHLYSRFKDLTPKIARDKNTGDLVYWWDKRYGHSANWIIQNAEFCLNFCIETALKFQKEEDNRYTLIQYNDVFEDIIEAIEDEVIIWDQSSHAAEFPSPFTNEPPEPRKPVFIMKKGQSIVGYATDSEDRLDEWSIWSKDIPSKTEDLNQGIGYVLKSAVKVTKRRKKKAE